MGCWREGITSTAKTTLEYEPRSWRSVQEWVTDPQDPNRQFGWVTLPADGLYIRPVQRVAVRCRKKNGQWGIGVILSTLPPEEVLELVGESAQRVNEPQVVLWAYVRFYEQRGGGVEIEIKEDKHGLGTRRRNKKRFAAQQMVVLLETLAHNILVWARRWLAATPPGWRGQPSNRMKQTFVASQL